MHAARHAKDQKIGVGSLEVPAWMEEAMGKTP
jgi:hypothetical protein